MEAGTHRSRRCDADGARSGRARRERGSDGASFLLEGACEGIACKRTDVVYAPSSGSGLRLRPRR